MATIEVKNPSTGSVIELIEKDSSQSIRTKFDEAKKVQKLWRSSSIEERLRCANAFSDLLKANLDALARDLTLETGKPISQSRGEIKSVTSRIEFFVNHAPAVLAQETRILPSSGMTEVVEHEALGVIANISAWNYPYFVGLNVLIPALLAGNGVLYKPSEFATRSGLNIVRLLLQAGFPKGLIASVVGKSEEGEALLDLPIDGVFFTGSLRTGQKILNQVSSRMIRVQLELGGQDGIYVCDDASINYAAGSIAEGAFYNAGQGCCSVERLFVHASIYDRFLAHFLDEVKNYKIGDPLKDDTFIGPLTRFEHLAFLENQIRDINGQGAKTILGGHRIDRPGTFFEPTVIESSVSSQASMTEESFGPIVVVQMVHDDKEAITRLNASKYGLTAGVYTPDQERALSILREVQVGTAYWNCCDRVSPFLPWSGRKSSGVGVTLGLDGFRAFVHSKAWHLRPEPKILE